VKERTKRTTMTRTPKATEAQVRQRVEELLRIRLDGAELWDVRKYVREKVEAKDQVWGEKPLSDGQLYRYLQKVDALLAHSCKSGRKRLIRRHLTQRRALYARSVNAADLRTALAILQDEAELLGLYPPKRKELSGPRGSAIPIRVIEVAVEPNDADRTEGADGSDARQAPEIQLPPRPAAGLEEH
jgi:hypothetical protein